MIFSFKRAHRSYLVSAKMYLLSEDIPYQLMKDFLFEKLSTISTLVILDLSLIINFKTKYLYLKSIKMEFLKLRYSVLILY